MSGGGWGGGWGGGGVSVRGIVLGWWSLVKGVSK